MNMYHEERQDLKMEVLRLII